MATLLILGCDKAQLLGRKGDSKGMASRKGTEVVMARHTLQNHAHGDLFSPDPKSYFHHLQIMPSQYEVISGTNLVIKSESSPLSDWIHHLGTMPLAQEQLFSIKPYVPGMYAYVYSCVCICLLAFNLIQYSAMETLSLPLSNPNQPSMAYPLNTTVILSSHLSVSQNGD